MNHLHLVKCESVDLYDSLSRANASHRAGRASPEPQSSFRLGLSATIAFAVMLACTIYAISLWVVR